MSQKPDPKKANPLVNFTPPSKEFVKKLIAPLKFYFSPSFYGMDNLDSTRPALYITNHTVFGVTDGTLFGAEMYLKKDIFLMSLVDKAHFNVPFWRDIIPKIGFINGSREACAELMRQKKNILVYPGGARETCKLKGEKYKLTWKKRTGFARMAIEFGYDIVPVTSIGGDDAYDIHYDSEDIMSSPAGKFLELTGLAKRFFKNGEEIPPIATGIGITSLPKPVKLYIKYGKRISTKALQGKEDDKDVLWSLRNKVEDAMNEQFEELFAIRKVDKDKSPLRRFLEGI
ncbi:MAG: lysophospholipid acyltransferase family protein [Chitinophagales bacterium]